MQAMFKHRFKFLSFSWKHHNSGARRIKEWHKKFCKALYFKIQLKKTWTLAQRAAVEATGTGVKAIISLHLFWQWTEAFLSGLHNNNILEDLFNHFSIKFAILSHVFLCLQKIVRKKKINRVSGLAGANGHFYLIVILTVNTSHWKFCSGQIPLQQLLIEVNNGGLNLNRVKSLNGRTNRKCSVVTAVHRDKHLKTNLLDKL